MSAPAPQPADEPGAHILVVDDDKRIRSLLSRYLAAEGYLVSAAADAAQARARLADMTFDLIVLDVMMPVESGPEFARKLRSEAEPLRSAPILMLTARGETADRVAGLEAGVDDYLAKPFEPRELSLRIASILRRTGRARRPIRASSVRFGAFRFDLENGRLREQGRIVHLTTREEEMLRVLAMNAGEIVSRQRLAQRLVNGKVESAGERSVDVEVARLRRKLGGEADGPLHLQTIRGRGYRLWVDAVIRPDEEDRKAP